MKAIYGLYEDPHVAQQAVDNLRAAGVADANITVISVSATPAARRLSTARWATCGSAYSP